LAAVIPIEDLRLLERLAWEEMDRMDIDDARAALKETRRGPFLSGTSCGKLGTETWPTALNSLPPLRGPPQARSLAHLRGTGEELPRHLSNGDEVLLVLVVKVGDRKEVYRRVK
jgi:hypothetical protein